MQDVMEMPVVDVRKDAEELAVYVLDQGGEVGREVVACRERQPSIILSILRL